MLFSPTSRYRFRVTSPLFRLGSPGNKYVFPYRPRPADRGTTILEKGAEGGGGTNRQKIFITRTDRRQRCVWKRAIRTWAICRCLLEKREPRVQRNIGTLFHQPELFIIIVIRWGIGGGKETVIKTRPRPGLLLSLNVSPLLFFSSSSSFFFRFWFSRSAPINNSGKRIKDRGSISRQDYIYTHIYTRRQINVVINYYVLQLRSTFHSFILINCFSYMGDV